MYHDRPQDHIGCNEKEQRVGRDNTSTNESGLDYPADDHSSGQERQNETLRQSTKRYEVGPGRKHRHGNPERDRTCYVDDHAGHHATRIRWGLSPRHALARELQHKRGNSKAVHKPQLAGARCPIHAGSQLRIPRGSPVFSLEVNIVPGRSGRLKLRYPLRRSVPTSVSPGSRRVLRSAHGRSTCSLIHRLRRGSYRERYGHSATLIPLALALGRVGGIIGLGVGMSQGHAFASQAERDDPHKNRVAGALNDRIRA